MDELIRTVETAALMEDVRELLQTVEQLPLRVSGNSMAPFLVHGRDTVYLSRVARPLKVGDVVLYQRESGAYILHRICRREGPCYVLVGDAQTALEHGIREEQIFALVVRVVRKGKTQAPGSFWWEFFEKIWVRMIPCRPFLMRGYRAVSNLVRRCL